MPLARQPTTLARRAVAQIQDLILRGELGPGERLRIEDLAAMLDMSPMPIREALQQLETLGFVEHAPHRGARVREWTAADLMDLYSLRIPLERLAIGRAAAQFTQDDERRGREALAVYADLCASGDADGARQAHLRFHLTLYEAARSSWLVRSIRPVLESGERYRLATLGMRGSLDSLREEHEDILEACVDRDPQRAATAVGKHLVQTVHLLVPGVMFEDDGTYDRSSVAQLALEGTPFVQAARRRDGLTSSSRGLGGERR